MSGIWSLKNIKTGVGGLTFMPVKNWDKDNQEKSIEYRL